MVESQNNKMRVCLGGEGVEISVSLWHFGVRISINCPLGTREIQSFPLLPYYEMFMRAVMRLRASCRGAYGREHCSKYQETNGKERRTTGFMAVFFFSFWIHGHVQRPSFWYASN